MNKKLSSDDLRNEYQFDYSQAKPNRFAIASEGAERLSRPAEDRSKEICEGQERSMSTEENLRKLREAAATFAHDREKVEAKIARINATIDQLCKARMIAADHSIIGPVVHDIADQQSESAQYFAAGIQGGGGIGAFTFWLNWGDKPDDFTSYNFVAFTQCPPVVQARLAGPIIDDLLARLMEELHVQG